MITYFTMKLMEYAWMIEQSITSMVLFGEYPYPAKEDYEQALFNHIKRTVSFAVRFMYLQKKFNPVFFLDAHIST